MRLLMQKSWIFIDPAHVKYVQLVLQQEGVTIAGKHLHIADFRSWHIIAGPGYHEIIREIDGMGWPSNLQLTIRAVRERRIRIWRSPEDTERDLDETDQILSG